MFHLLKNGFSGDLYYDDSSLHRAIRMSYATDASVYQEKPLAVVIPRTVDDLRLLIEFAQRENRTLIPRAAGTSLAGQVVGNGIVVDISKYFTSIIEVNEEERWVSVQPGVIRDDLNAYLKPYSLMFGPETSTSNRAMIGGMIGNNSCGLHSIIWGDTRDSLMELTVLLADGSEAVFKNLTSEEYEERCKLNNFEGQIYRSLKQLLTDPENQQAIDNGFPKPSVHRRNTGYALDLLLEMFRSGHGSSINLSKLIAGSEGTLCFIVEAKLRLRTFPPPNKCIVAIHTKTINEALRANVIALTHHCSASELVDHIILEYTKTNIDQSKNRFFVEGEPRAILMVEFFSDTKEHLDQMSNGFINLLKQKNIGYAFPVLYGNDTDKAWDLRKAGLGLLRNEPGDVQPVNLIEDCAVDASDLPDYIDELEALLKAHHIRYSMYAHAGAGELHVEPMINLKTSEGKKLFRTILEETTRLVKKYRGSLSGEHGDGRLRGEFIGYMMGEKNYQLFRAVKQLFDPRTVFNKGKIVDTPPMNEFLRYQQDIPKEPVPTVFDFSKQEGILHLSEKCSGSGDCRKSHVNGGTMCPSFMATRSEKDATRARANMLRHFYTAKAYGIDNGVTQEEVKEVLDLCLSCKACKSECPTSVDVAKMKAEFTQGYYDRNGVPFRSNLIANFSSQMSLAAQWPAAYNFLMGTPAIRKLVNRIVGFHPDRTMPLLAKTTLRKWFKNYKKVSGHKEPLKGSVYLFCDEFTNYNDVETGVKTVLLLESLGYNVEIPEPVESGRTYLSKGMVRKAKAIAIRNVQVLSALLINDVPIIGIEPSAILTLRDEYIDLVPPEWKEPAQQVALNSYLFEEWFAREITHGNITSDWFSASNSEIHIHGHCFHKSLSSTKCIRQSLSIIPGCRVNEIPSGCCGMAGAFGYEREHYDVSVKIANLVLFPSINQLDKDAIIAASGTSCRHQIKDGTGRIARHTASILYDALLEVHKTISTSLLVR